jgi:hypothetical protein
MAERRPGEEFCASGRNRKQRSRAEEQRAEGVQRKKKRGKDPKDWFGNFRKFKGLSVN